MKRNILFFFALTFIFLCAVSAHGDLHERIVKTTVEIKKTPDSAYLYFKRGKLYFQHESYKKSISDLKKSNVLGHYSAEQQLLFAKSYFRLENYNKSLSYIDKVLVSDSKNVRFIKLKAQSYFKLNQFYNAAIQFEKVIEHVTKSFPENYIDASIAWETLGTEEGIMRSKKVLLNGIKDLGQLISLNERLIDLAIHQKDYEGAIEVQKGIVNLSNRKESAYYRLSELYLLNNDKKKTLACLALAKEHFVKLPDRLKHTSFMKSLKDKINTQEYLLLTNQ